jgi:hypothetical protein
MPELNGIRDVSWTNLVPEKVHENYPQRNVASNK